MRRLIPFLGLASILGGTAVMGWYSRLTSQGKQDADRAAFDFATGLLDHTVNRLGEANATPIPRLGEQTLIG